MGKQRVKFTFEEELLFPDSRVTVRKYKIKTYI